MSLAKQIDYGSAHPPISREEVMPMSEWLKKHGKEKGARFPVLWRAK